MAGVATEDATTALPTAPRRPPSGSDSDVESSPDSDVPMATTAVPTAGAAAQHATTHSRPGAAHAVRAANESGPDNARVRVRATGAAALQHPQQLTPRDRLDAVALPVPITPGAAPGSKPAHFISGKKRPRHSFTKKEVAQAASMLSNAAAVLSSRFLATAKGVVHPAATPMAVRGAPQCVVSLEPRRRALMLTASSGAHTVVGSVVRAVASVLDIPAPPVAIDAGGCARVALPAAALSAVVLRCMATEPTAAAPVALSFAGVAAPALATVAARLRAVSDSIRRVLGAPWSWPVLMTRSHDGERYVSVRSYADLHASVESAPLDLVRHRSVSALLRRMPGVEVTQLPGMPGLYARLAAGVPGAHAKPLPEVESVAAPAPRRVVAPPPSASGAATPRPVKRRRMQAPPATAPVPPPSTQPKRVRFSVPPRAPRASSPGGAKWVPRPGPSAEHDVADEQARLLRDAAAEFADTQPLDRHMGLVGLKPGHWQSACPWERLGLSGGATLRDVRRRYRVLALRLHPDKSADPDAARAFAAVAAAYEQVLKLMGLQQ